MRKKLLPVLCAIAVSLFFYSCSDPILPKRVEIAGTVNLPARVGAADFNTMFVDAIQEVLSGEGDEIKVYNVDYKGQTVQTFCIYLPIEMTENLNPTDFLKTINRQINNDISTDPLRINPIEMPVPPGGQIPISLIKLPVIGPINLDDIARYVTDITFHPCDEKTVKSGIGLNFHLDKVVDGLEMIVECAELNFKSDHPKPLKSGNNIIFGNKADENKDDFTLLLAGTGYQDKSKGLNFTIRLQSAGPDKDMLDLSAAGLTPGETVTIMEGEVSFFQNWTKATIDMKAAIKASEMEDGFFGTFPDITESGGFNLSKLGNFLDGEFTIDGLETKIYMHNPVSFEMHLALIPWYTGQESTGSLYEGEFSVDKNPFILSENLKDGNYTSKHLPGFDSAYKDGGIDEDVIADIFDKMPYNLHFEYRINFVEDRLEVTPNMFSEDDKVINMALIIMLPLHLVAVADGSVFSFPDMFGKSNDLLGRREADKDGDLLEFVKIEKIKMTIDFLNPIFSGGHLFIDGDKNTDPLLFYPDGIKLSGKRAIMDFTDSQIEIVQANLIKPNFWIKLDKGNRVTVPKNMGMVGVKFELKGIVQTGDFLE
jgi:hypothetical protein